MAATLPRTEGQKGLHLVRLLLSTVAAFVVVIAVGNAVIFGLTTWARATAAPTPIEAPAGINNFRVVDDKVWRGAAPTRAGYANLAAAGVKTIVDLRAEEYVNVDEAYLDSLGLKLVRIPIRDGQTPTPEEVDRFLAAVNGTTGGPTFVHCGAGVGRTGTMVAAYRVAMGASGLEALRGNLSVGPPSLEQIAFALKAKPAGAPSNHSALVAISRVLDAPRRTWARLSH
jgi:protein-tyrosine phosphatase